MDKLKNKIQENIHDLDIDQPSLSTWGYIKNSLSNTVKDDLLKTHIQNSKAQLDTEVPGDGAWASINKGITERKQAAVRPFRKIIIYISAAACIITIISLTLFRYRTGIETTPGSESNKGLVAKEKAGPVKEISIDTVKQQLALETGMPAVQEEASRKTEATHTAAVAARPGAKPHKTTLPPQVLQMEKDYDELIAGQIKYTRSLAIYGEPASYFEKFKNDFTILDQQEKKLRKTIAKNGLQENSIDELAMIYQQKLTVLKKLQNEINKTSSRNKNVTDTIPAYINL